MKPPIKSLAGLAPLGSKTEPYARPTPMVARRKTAKVMTEAERAAFLAARPDLER